MLQAAWSDLFPALELVPGVAWKTLPGEGGWVSYPWTVEQHKSPQVLPPSCLCHLQGPVSPHLPETRQGEGG